jgi:heat-inducible transcriptional repressor
MLDDRKAAILRAVVEEYIETAQPVGSGFVAAAPGVDVSSATVRNEMAHLEAEGFLAQPHTSAGRIPTEKGYRFFVDHLRPSTDLRGQSAEQVRAFFDRAHGEVEQMLASASLLLSNLTDLAGVVVAPSPATATLRAVQLVSLHPGVALVVVILSDGTIERHAVDIPPDITDEQLATASTHLALHLVGHLRTSLRTPPTSGNEVTDLLVGHAMTTMSSPDPPEPETVYVGGTSRVAEAFDAIETVRQVLGLLEQQYLVVTLLRDVLNRGLHVAIGSETGVEPLASCALVVAPYESEGQRLGTIGVLGPTRMNYPQALAAVAVVSDRLSDRLAEG